MIDPPNRLPSHLTPRFQKPGQRRSMSRSATRALDIMELFGAHARPMRAIEIARLLETNPSTANQLLKTMVDSAHLIFDAKTKTYLPSPRMAGFTNWFAEFYGSGGRLRELVARVHEATGMVVTITTPNDLAMQVIVSAEAGPTSAERGGRVPLFGSVSGAAHLVNLDEKELRRLAYRARIPDDQLPFLEAELALIRERGFAVGRSMNAETWTLSLPVPRQLTRVPVVLGLAGPAEVIEREAIAIAARMRAIMCEVLQDDIAYI